MKDFRTLKVWEKGHALTLCVYRETRKFPREEAFGLTSQVRRAASSIGASIAEGCGRGSVRDFQRFLVIAHGSAVELEYHFLLARDLAYISQSQYAELQARVNEVQRVLWGLIRRVGSGDVAAA